ncbi:MAG: response regulator transcription factor [Spirochaetales bacterium]|nr:response regulator transcription factor [Spirochaetales bacterium]
MKKTIYVVDDEHDIREIISFNLKSQGYLVENFETGEELLEKMKKILPDLVLLDLMLPGIDGLEVCKRLKMNPSTASIPVLILTAKTDDTDQIIGLELGADDYVVKPFSPRVLTARIKALFRRNSAVIRNELIVSIHGVNINSEKRAVDYNGTEIELSRTEFDILQLMASNPGKVFTRSSIIEKVKGDDYPVTDRSVDVQITGIRKKLSDNGIDLIETVRGVGYRIKDI